MPKTTPIIYCEPCDVASWIGLTDASRLGTEPILLDRPTVDRLELHGPRVELTPGDVAAILRVGPKQVRAYIRTDRKVVLGHRHTPAGKVLICAADLAAFVNATVSPPVPTTGSRVRADQAAIRRADRALAERHKI